eukprot:RCo020079
MGCACSDSAAVEVAGRPGGAPLPSVRKITRTAPPPPSWNPHYDPNCPVLEKPESKARRTVKVACPHCGLSNTLAAAQREFLCGFCDKRVDRDALAPPAPPPSPQAAGSPIPTLEIVV